MESDEIDDIITLNFDKNSNQNVIYLSKLSDFLKDYH